jgi:hypothetical protein
MARFMVSMPDEIVEKLDRRARKERRSRSALLREAVKRHLSAAAPDELKKDPVLERNGKHKAQKKWTKKRWNGTSWKRGSPGEAALGLILWSAL